MRVAVTGAGGFIGAHLCRELASRGAAVRGVDLRYPEFGQPLLDDFRLVDLWAPPPADLFRDCDEVYALAADMGGMGYLAGHDAEMLRTNLRIDLNTLAAAEEAGVRRLLYASSACVYNEDLQAEPEAAGLREEDAYPARPDTDYGWEKLTGERLCAAARRRTGLDAKAARLHNVYGPLGAWRGGREKAPAAVCRKVAVAKLTGAGEVEVWGDGKQRRSFLYVQDCVDGLVRLMASACAGPLNLGSERSVSADELVAMVATVAGVEVTARHADGPQGVRGRRSDNSRVRAELDWDPATSLEEGLALTYAWVEAQVLAAVEEGEVVS